MPDKTYSLIIEGFKAAGGMGAANGPPTQPGVGGPSAPSGDSGGGGGASDTKLAGMAEKGIKLQEKQPAFLGKIVKKMGINVGISSILKQSQIFTGTIGSVFQIFGALVDVILAPFLPIIVPIIRMLGNLIPAIHKTINGIINWYDTNISPMLTDFGQKVGGWISDHLLGWLPESIQVKIREWFEKADWGKWVKNLFLGGIMLGILSKFGFLKILGPIGFILAKIPVLGPLLAKMGGLAVAIGRSVATMLGLGKLFPKAAGGGLKTHDPKGFQRLLKTDAATAKAAGGGGMFGKLKGGLSKLGPKSLMAAAKSAGPMGILKGVAKKAIPGLSSVMLMYQGIKGGIDVFKSNMAAGESVWKSLGKSSAVVGTAAVASGLSFVPGMGLIAPIAGGMATSYMTKKMMASPPGEDKKMTQTVYIDGKPVIQSEMDEREGQRTRELDSQGYDVSQGEFGMKGG